MLQRIGGTLNTRARAQIYKTCIKPHLDFCLPVWVYCRPEQAKLGKTITRATQIVTSCCRATVGKSGMASFNDLKTVAVACQLFNSIYSADSQHVSLLSHINKSMQTRASVVNKYLLTLSKRSCDNCFFI